MNDDGVANESSAAGGRATMLPGANLLRGGRWSHAVGAAIGTLLCAFVLLRGDVIVMLVAVVGLGLWFGGLATDRATAVSLGAVAVLGTAVAASDSLAGVVLAGGSGLLALHASHLGSAVRHSAGTDARTGRAEFVHLAAVGLLLAGAAVVWAVAGTAGSAAVPESWAIGLFGAGVVLAVYVLSVRE